MVFRPKLSLVNGHQVSWMTGAKSVMIREVYNKLKYEREIFMLSDGAEIAIDSRPVKDGDDQNRPLLIIIPGMLSGVHDHYHHTLIDLAVKNGYDWKLINYRGVTHRMTTGVPFCSLDS